MQAPYQKSQAFLFSGKHDVSERVTQDRREALPTRPFSDIISSSSPFPSTYSYVTYAELNRIVQVLRPLHTGVVRYA